MSIMLLYPGARYGLDGDALVVVLADGTEIARLPPAEPPIVQPNISS
jgi:hypothetical protein